MATRCSRSRAESVDRRRCSSVRYNLLRLPVLPPSASETRRVGRRSGLSPRGAAGGRRAYSARSSCEYRTPTGISQRVMMLDDNADRALTSPRELEIFPSPCRRRAIAFEFLKRASRREVSGPAAEAASWRPNIRHAPARQVLWRPATCRRVSRARNGLTARPAVRRFTSAGRVYPAPARAEPNGARRFTRLINSCVRHVMGIRQWAAFDRGPADRRSDITAGSRSDIPRRVSEQNFRAIEECASPARVRVER